MCDFEGNDSKEENRGLTLSATLSPSAQNIESLSSVKGQSRLIAPHSLVEEPETREAIQHNVKNGLAKVLRKSSDSNRVDIVVPKNSLRSPGGSFHRAGNHPASAEPPRMPNKAIMMMNVTHRAGHNINVPVKLESVEADSVVGNPMSVLGEGRVDPFASYPIKMNKGELWLMDQVNANEELTFKNLKERWLPLAINDPGAFHQFLSNVALNISILSGGERNGLISVAHHSLAVRTVNQQLSDPLLRTSNNIIASIVEFTCYSISQDDFTSCSIHLDGLENIIRIRGGTCNLGNSMLSKLIYGVDISAACRFDANPRFPLPEESFQNNVEQTPQEQEFHREFTQKSPLWQKLLPTDNPLIKVFDGINSAIIHAKFKESKKEKWKCVEYILHWIDPIMHNLLSLGTGTDKDNAESLLYNMCRLGICVFVGPIRRNCGKLGVSTKVYVKKLKQLLSNPCNANVIKVPRPFMLWILFFGMLESHGLQDEQWYLASLVKTARSFGLAWDDLVKTVSGFLWMDNVFQKELEDAKKRFTAKMEAF